MSEELTKLLQEKYNELKYIHKELKFMNKNTDKEELQEKLKTIKNEYRKILFDIKMEELENDKHKRR